MNMKKYHFNMDRENVLKLLEQECPNKEIVENVVGALEILCEHYEEECKKRQKEGMQKARESGVVLGRPKIRMPERFDQIVEEWEKGNVKAAMAAQLCGMGVSTFYRRARDYRDERKNAASC